MPTPPPPSGSSLSGRELFRDAYIVVRLDAGGRVVRLVRSAVAYQDIPSLVASFEAVIVALDRVSRKGRVMLFDTRAPSGRNDPDFEAAMARLRPRIDRQFGRIGVVVASAVGSLQIRRWVSADGIERLVGTSETEVLDALLAGLPSR
jgi:hypothetical protein